MSAALNSETNWRNFSDKTKMMSFDDDDDVNALILEESGALAAVAVKPHVGPAHDADRTCLWCRGPHLARDCPDRKTH